MRGSFKQRPGAPPFYQPMIPPAFIKTFLRFLEWTHVEDESENPELGEFFTSKHLICAMCSHKWHALAPVELESVFDSAVVCPSCDFRMGVEDDGEDKDL